MAASVQPLALVGKGRDAMGGAQIRMIERADRNNQVRGDSLEHRGTFTPQALADYWGVHVQTIYRDIRKGALAAFRLPGGSIRIRAVDAQRYGRPTNDH